MRFLKKKEVEKYVFNLNFFEIVLEYRDYYCGVCVILVKIFLYIRGEMMCVFLVKVVYKFIFYDDYKGWIF